MSLRLLLVTLFLCYLNPVGALTRPIPPIEIPSKQPVKEKHRLSKALKVQAFKIFQTILLKKDRLKDRERGIPTGQQRRQGRLSWIFGITSLVALVVPTLGLLSLPLAIAGLVLGIKSVKGNSNTEGIVGIVTSSVTLFLFLLALLVIAALITAGGF